jgi:predicted nuclease of predicted toxin-antitoxin system
VRFLLDHDVPGDVAFSLEALGHGVVKLREVLPVTTPDYEVLREAAERESLLITCNRDDFLAVAGRVPHYELLRSISPPKGLHSHRRENFSPYTE